MPKTMTKKKNNKYSMKEQLNIEDDDNWFKSFMEIVSAVLRILIIGGCLLIVKSIFDLAIDMFNNVEYQNSEVMKFELIAVGVLAIVAVLAIWIIGRDDD